MKNIVLIGMPGSGKTTVGQWLAEMLNMKFVDTDALVEHLSQLDGVLRVRRIR